MRASLALLSTRCCVVQMPGARVEGLVLSQCGRHLLANCGDKAIREFDVAERLSSAASDGGNPGCLGQGVRSVSA